MFEDGRPFDERAQAAASLGGTNLDIEVDLGAGGDHRATVWTCCKYVEDVPSRMTRNPHVKRIRGRSQRTKLMVSQHFLSILDFHARRPAPHTGPGGGAEGGTPRQSATSPHAATMAGRRVGLLFEKPSLRTRVTFTIGIESIGGSVVDIPSDVMHANREPLHDVARNLRALGRRGQ